MKLNLGSKGVERVCRGSRFIVVSKIFCIQFTRFVS